jgi:hypothetical protein
MRLRFNRVQSARFPDATQRDSGAPLIRDRQELRVSNDPGSAAHHFVLRCARDTGVSDQPVFTAA